VFFALVRQATLRAITTNHRAIVVYERVIATDEKVVAIVESLVETNKKYAIMQQQRAWLIKR